MIQTAKRTDVYHNFVFYEIKKEINDSIKFINHFCQENDLKSLKDYFWYKSEPTQIYPDSLDHLFKNKISSYYLAYNKIFIHYFYSLSSDLKEELDLIFKISEKQIIIKNNTYLFFYLKKLLGKSFLF